MCYKILNNLVCINDGIFFKRSIVHNTEGNSMKLNKYHIIRPYSRPYYVGLRR